jgi:hypothetical protein
MEQKQLNPRVASGLRGAAVSAATIALVYLLDNYVASPSGLSRDLPALAPFLPIIVAVVGVIKGALKGRGATDGR